MHQRTKKDPAPTAGGGAGAAGADIWSTPRAPPSEPPARGRDGSVPPRTWAGRWPVGRPTAFSKRPCAGPPGTSRGGGMRFRRRGSGRPARGLCSSPRSRRPGPDVWPGQVIVVLSARGRLACPGGFRPSTHHGGALFIYVRMSSPFEAPRSPRVPSCAATFLIGCSTWGIKAPRDRRPPLPGLRA